MKSNYKIYDFEKSRERIDDILNTADKSFEEVDKIPSRDKLTFNNGFYVNKIYVNLSFNVGISFF